MQPLFLFSFFLTIINFNCCWVSCSAGAQFLSFSLTRTLARVCSEMSSYGTPGGGVVTITVAQKINQMFVIHTRGQNCTGGFALKWCAAAQRGDEALTKQDQQPDCQHPVIASFSSFLSSPLFSFPSMKDSARGNAKSCKKVSAALNVGCRLSSEQNEIGEYKEYWMPTAN